MRKTKTETSFKKKPSLFWLKGNKADLILAEINIPQGPFEFLACGEAGKHAVDLVCTDSFGGVCAAGIGSQPEGAEIAQFDDVALGELIGDDKICVRGGAGRANAIGTVISLLKYDGVI